MAGRDTGAQAPSLHPRLGPFSRLCPLAVWAVWAAEPRLCLWRRAAFLSFILLFSAPLSWGLAPLPSTVYHACLRGLKSPSKAMGAALSQHPLTPAPTGWVALPGAYVKADNDSGFIPCQSWCVTYRVGWEPSASHS